MRAGQAAQQPDRPAATVAELGRHRRRHGQARIERPGSAEEVAAAVGAARADGLTVRMVGSGHSFTEVAVADGSCSSPTRCRLTEVDRTAMTVTVLAGTRLHELNAGLAALGLALHNMGDIDRQTVAGALSTGTHGTGGVTASFAGQVEAFDLVDGTGTTPPRRPPVRPRPLRRRPGLARRARRAHLGDPAGRAGIRARGRRDGRCRGQRRSAATTSWSRGTTTSTCTGSRTPTGAWSRPTTAPSTTLRPSRRVRAWFDDDLLSNTLFGKVDAPCTRMPALTPRVNRVTSRLLERPQLPRRLARGVHLPAQGRLPRDGVRPSPRGGDAGADRGAGPGRARGLGGAVAGGGALHACRRGVALHHPRAGVGLPRLPHGPAHGPPAVLRGRGEAAARPRRPPALGQDAHPHRGRTSPRRTHGGTTSQKVRDRLDPDRVFSNRYVDRVLG